MNDTEKQTLILSLFSPNDIFQLKDIIKQSIKKGISEPTIKPNVEILVQENKLNQEKIGTSQYYFIKNQTMEIKKKLIEKREINKKLLDEWNELETIKYQDNHEIVKEIQELNLEIQELNLEIQELKMPFMEYERMEKMKKMKKIVDVYDENILVFIEYLKQTFGINEETIRNEFAI
jgi:DNA-binding transcriptional MerR regulator